MAFISVGRSDVQVLEPEGKQWYRRGLYKNTQFIERLNGDTVLILSSDKYTGWITGFWRISMKPASRCNRNAYPSAA
jgi:hypothetical protein